MWKRGLVDGKMPDHTEMVFASNSRDAAGGPGMGFRSDRLSNRRVDITTKMKLNSVKRPKGSKEAQEIRHRRELCHLTCA
jgi:hypothetical protein